MIKGSRIHRTEFLDKKDEWNLLIVGQDKEGYYAILYTDPSNKDEFGNRNYNTAFTLRRDEESDLLEWYYMRAISLTPTRESPLKGLDISDEKIKPSLLVNDSLVAAEMAIDILG